MTRSLDIRVLLLTRSCIDRSGARSQHVILDIFLAHDLCSRWDGRNDKCSIVIFCRRYILNTFYIHQFWQHKQREICVQCYFAWRFMTTVALDAKSYPSLTQLHFEAKENDVKINKCLSSHTLLCFLVASDYVVGWQSRDFKPGWK